MTRFLLTIVFLLCIVVANAQTFVATQDINVRKGAGSKYESMGVLVSGSSIEVVASHGKWSKIIVQGNEGYVFSKYLEANTSSSISNASTTSTGSSGYMKWLAIGSIIVALVIFRKTPLVSILFKLISGIFPEASSALSSRSNESKQVYCSRCGEIKRGSVTGNLPNCEFGGRHVWKV